MIAVKSQGQVWILAGKLDNFKDTSRIAMEPLGIVWIPLLAVKSPGRVWGPAG